jgi:hypothetical protein
MEFSYTLSGATPRKRLVILGEQSDVAGVPLIAGTAAKAGPIKASTTAAVDTLGVQINVPTNSYQTAKNTDNSENASIAEVIVSPDAVYKVRLSGSSTSGTALTTYTASATASDGATATFASLASTFDEGTLHCITGANKGVSRRIASITTNVATLTVAFPAAITSGDEFIVVPYAPDTALQYVQLTSDLTELDASVAVDTDNVNFRVVEMKLAGVSDSYAYVVAADHLYGQG